MEDENDVRDHQTSGGVTALMLAVESMNYELITECLNTSMNPLFVDALGREAKDYAGTAVGVERNPEEIRSLAEIIDSAKEQWLSNGTVEELTEDKK